MDAIRHLTAAEHELVRVLQPVENFLLPGGFQGYPPHDDRDALRVAIDGIGNPREIMVRETAEVIDQMGVIGQKLRDVPDHGQYIRTCEGLTRFVTQVFTIIGEPGNGVTLDRAIADWLAPQAADLRRRLADERDRYGRPREAIDRLLGPLANLEAAYNEAVQDLPRFVGVWRAFLEQLASYLTGLFRLDHQPSLEEVTRSLREVESFRVNDGAFTAAIAGLVDPLTAVLHSTMSDEEIARDRGPDGLSERLKELCPALFPRPEDDPQRRPKLDTRPFILRLDQLAKDVSQIYARNAKYQRWMELIREGEELVEEAALLRRSADADIHFAQMRNEEKIARLNELYRAQCDAIVTHYESLFAEEG